MIGVSAVAVRLHSHNVVSHVHHLLNGVVYLVADDGSPPRCHGVSPPGPHTHSGCGPEGTTAVDGDRPSVVEADKSAQELTWEPRALSARGLKQAILAECTMRVVIQSHLKNRHETITNPKVINSEK
jgi:hypothetical protein